MIGPDRGKEDDMTKHLTKHPTFYLGKGNLTAGQPIKIQAIWNSGLDTDRWDAKIYCPFQGEKAFSARFLVTLWMLQANRSKDDGGLHF